MDFVFVKSQKKGKEGYGSVYARVRSNGKNKKYVLGLTIKENEWLKYKSLKYVSSAIMTSIGIRYGQFVNILMQIKHVLEENFDPNTAPKVIHGIIFSNLNNMDVEAPEPLKENDILFRDFMEKYIEELENGTRLKRGRAVPVSEGHCHIMHIALARFRDYETKIKKRLTLNDITMDFQRGFVKYLKERGNKQNTINLRLGSIRNAMHIAYVEKKTSCIDYQHPDFVPAKEEVDEIYLSPEQVNQMIEMDLTTLDSLNKMIRKARFSKERKKTLPLINNKVLNNMRRVRDIFVIGCLTGQRVSDYKRINNEMLVEIQGKTFIKLKQIKTEKTVMIPYDLRVKKILEQYEGELPKIGILTFNNHLRFIGELLGWTNEVLFDDAKEEKRKRFCDMMSSHTARRTFATNAYAAGIPLVSILSVTGHYSERSLRTYLRLDSTEKAIIAAEDFKDFIQHR